MPSGCGADPETVDLQFQRLTAGSFCAIGAVQVLKYGRRFFSKLNRSSRRDTSECLSKRAGHCPVEDHRPAPPEF